MLELSAELGIDPSKLWPGRNINVLSAAQFNNREGESKVIASSMLTELEADLEAVQKGKWVQTAVWNALQGKWRLHRRLESLGKHLPSGTFTGSATFTRSPIPGTESAKDLPSFELKYLEEGRLVTDTKLEFDAQRRYRYQFTDYLDRIDVFFDDSSGEGFFHSLRVLAPTENAKDVDKAYDGSWEPWVGEKRAGWRAVGEHWCQPDDYKVAYWFAFDGVQLDEFRIGYQVKGPYKDYFTCATYTR